MTVPILRRLRVYGKWGLVAALCAVGLLVASHGYACEDLTGDEAVAEMVRLNPGAKPIGRLSARDAGAAISEYNASPPPTALVG